MRRTLGTDVQKHGSLNDTQGILRHASIRTTGDIYVQPIDASVHQAVIIVLGNFPGIRLSGFACPNSSQVNREPSMFSGHWDTRLLPRNNPLRFVNRHPRRKEAYTGESPVCTFAPFPHSWRVIAGMLEAAVYNEIQLFPCPP